MFRRVAAHHSCAVQALWPDVEVVGLPSGDVVPEHFSHTAADVVALPPSRSAVSLARRIVQPVLMMPPTSPEGTARVLAAAGSPRMDEAVLGALKSCAADGLEVVVARVDTTPAVVRDCVTAGGLAFAAVPSGRSEERFTPLLVELWAQGLRARLRVEQGTVGTTLEAVINDERPRLVVLGVAPKRWWPQTGLGLRLARRTGRPVLLQRCARPVDQ